MARQQSSNKSINEKRLRRKKFILGMWGLWKSFFNWVLKVVTFKKCVVVFCIYYVTDIVEYWKVQNALGVYVSDTVMVTVITAFIVELGLSALLSKSRKETNYESEDIEEHG